MTTTIPDYVTGTWDIDPNHSDISFVVRHLGVTKVRGRFNHVAGEIVTAEDPAASRVSVTINADSIDTKNSDRDNHVRSAEFLDVEAHEHLTFTSTGVRAEGGEYKIDGDLTVHGVTRPVTLDAELGGFGPGMTEGSTVVGVSAKTTINRTDFGVGAGLPTAIVAEKVVIELDVEAVLRG